MPAPDRQPDGHDEHLLPGRLSADLRAMFNHTITIAPTIDDAVLAEAHRRLVAQRRRRRWLRYALPLTAAAAACIALCIMFLPRTSDQPIITGDINADGQVNIIDAFTLAKSLENPGIERPASWDVNHDLRIDPLDVDAIARQAVALPDVDHGGLRG